MVSHDDPAAPSAAPETPSYADFEAEANAADLAGRRPRSPTPPAAPSPAQPADQAVTDAPSETPPAAPSPAPPEKRPERRATENRVHELLAERAQLRRELEALKATPATPDAPPAASSAAPAVPAFPTYDAYLAEHPEASYEDYLDARADFRVTQTLNAARDTAERAQQAVTATQQIEQRDEQFRTQIEAAEQADPGFVEHLSDDVKALKPRDALVRDASGRWHDPESGQFVLPGRIALAEALLASPIAPALLRHFSDHPEDVDRIVRLLPDAFFEALGVIKHRVSTASKTPATPPIKHVSDAPAPPSTLGKRPTAPTDAVDAALASGSFLAYQAAADAADLAAGRRR